MHSQEFHLLLFRHMQLLTYNNSQLLFRFLSDRYSRIDASQDQFPVGPDCTRFWQIS